MPLSNASSSLRIYEVTAFGPDCRRIVRSAQGLEAESMPTPAGLQAGDFFVPRTHGLLYDSMGSCSASYVRPSDQRPVGLHFTSKPFAEMHGLCGLPPGDPATWDRREFALELFRLGLGNFLGMGSTTVCPQIYTLGLFCVTGLLYHFGDVKVLPSVKLSRTELKKLNEDGRTSCAQCQGQLKTWTSGRYCLKCEP